MYLDYKICINALWRIPDSNRPPSDCEPDALPDELNPHCCSVQNYKKKLQNDVIILYIFLHLHTINKL